MHVVMVTSIHFCNFNVKFTICSRRRYKDVASTLRQLCKERKIWTIHGHMVTFPNFYLKAAEKFINDITFIWYTGPIL